MKELYVLVESSMSSAQKYRSGDFKRITFPILSGASFCIYQKYKTVPLEECFWEVHEDYVDVNVWLSGEEGMHSSAEIHDLSFMELTNEDFWTTKKGLSVSNSIILSSSNPVVIFATNIPHRCQISTGYEYIEKLTLKIQRDEFDRLT